MKKLSSILQFRNGKKRPKEDGEIPVYGGNGVLGYTNEKNYQNCIAIGRVGAYCGSVYYEKQDCWISDNAIVALAKNHVDIVYAYYLLKILKLNSRQIGTSQPLLTQDILNNIETNILPYEKQRTVGHLLKQYDDAITINEKINKNLEEQAQTLFKERFLSCDGLPERMKMMTLGDVSEISAGGDKPKTISSQKTDEYQYPVYSNGIGDDGLYGYTTDYKINAESVTVSARGTIGFVCLRHLPYTPIVRLVTLIPYTNIVSAKYLYLWLKNIPIQGTGTTQQQLTVPDFRRTRIIIPTKTDMLSFTETVTPLFQQIWTNQDENVKLANIRDALLPRLMSGELDVSNLEI